MSTHICAVLDGDLSWVESTLLWTHRQSQVTIAFQEQHYASLWCPTITHACSVKAPTYFWPDNIIFGLKPFKEWSMNEAVTVTKIITSLHHLLSFRCAWGLMLLPLIAKWSLNRLYKWEGFICLEAAVHYSPVIQLILEVMQATRWANTLMIHMWNHCTDLYTIGPYCRACNIIAITQFLMLISFK